MVGETPARLVLALHLVGVEGEKPDEPTMNDSICGSLLFLDLATWLLSSGGGGV
tara:strand:- start:16 stop:177 length:162 start_codon:yes stop_codon:yes gene_type:complete